MNRWIEFIILLVFFIPIVISDLRKKRIPDICIYSCLGIILILRIVFKCNLSPRMLINLLTGFFFIWVIWLLTKGKIGLGDAKLSSLIAVVLGIPGWLLALFLAAVTGILFSLIRLSLAKMKKEDTIPFAPFLAAGSIASFFLAFIHPLDIILGSYI